MSDPAFSFGRFAADYELGRPAWPAEATVLDLGAGTGKLTRLLTERFSRVIAIEPMEAMRALIPAGAEVLAGTAEEIPLPNRSVAAVFCGESFHWFDWPRAIPEIVRVLRPRGGLALMWNRPSGGLPHSADLPQGVSDVLDRLADPSPAERRYGSFAWRDALAGSPFEDLRSAVIPYGGRIEREVLLARIGSWSPVASLPAEERESFLEEVGSQLAESSYQATLETHLYWTRLRG